MKRIAIFASGRGSNALQIIKHLQDSTDQEVTTILSNNRESGIIESAIKLDIPYLDCNRSGLYRSKVVLEHLQRNKIDYIILAGFMWLFPLELLEHYPERVLNIHPSLLPKYGGKGMYGMHVHHAVHQQNETHSGITIHIVNPEYDKGRILLQTKVKLQENDTAEQIASKVLRLEHHFYPRIVANYCK